MLFPVCYLTFRANLGRMERENAKYKEELNLEGKSSIQSTGGGNIGS